MTSVLKSSELNAVVKGLLDQGLSVHENEKKSGHFQVRFPSGFATTMNFTTGDSRGILRSRTIVKREGFRWPLDPEPRPPKMQRVPVPSPIPEPAPERKAPVATRAPKPKLTQSNEVLSEWIDLTPELAVQFLSKNTDNRTIRGSHIDELARDMTMGRWRVTGDSIKFDINDLLIDGQHRLMAVARSGVTIRVLLVLGLDPEAREVIDTNARRSARDALKFAGETKNVSIIAGAARIALAREAGVWTNALDTTSPHFTNSEVLAWVDDHPDVRQAVDLAVKTDRAIGIAPSPWAYCLYELLKLDDVDAYEFANSLAEFRTEGPGDPRLALLNAFRTASNTRGRYVRNPEAIFYVFRAWNAWRASLPAHKLMPAGRDSRNGQVIPNPQ